MGVGSQAIKNHLIVDVRPRKFKTCVRHQVLDIGQRACTQIVQYAYPVALRQQELREVRTDESSTAGDEDAFVIWLASFSHGAIEGRSSFWLYSQSGNPFS